jgi:acetolactate synthase-1/2/3 large subunit
MAGDLGFHGGVAVAQVLARRGVGFLFTLCGGHISPILAACKAKGLRVVDVRHEATAVFAADAMARLSGIPGVAAVTAGPGLTNTVTAVKNAQLAQSPVIVLGGAPATLLKGRGALQDIDQFALMKPHVKWAAAVTRVRDIVPALEQAFAQAQAGVPGPVFVELPVDLLYPEPLVRAWYPIKPADQVRGLRDRLMNGYLRRHLNRMFAPAGGAVAPLAAPVAPGHSEAQARAAAQLLDGAQRPLLLLGSQATLAAARVGAVRAAVEALGLPTYLSGMGRGLLGRQHPLLLRHQRKQALKAADLVILAGVPADFRLNYGRDLPRQARLIAVNRGAEDARKNRRPDLTVVGDPAGFLAALALAGAGGRWSRPEWLRTRREQDQAREAEIDAQAAPVDLGEGVNPVGLCRRLDDAIAEDSIIVGDGGDFVATASYTVKPRGPLSWLDPGVFGTLGSGAGFALGAKLFRPQAEVWVLFGDGSVGYSLSEWDTFVRHNVPVIAVVGNDASWSQIAREQVELLHDDVGTVLRHTDYHRVAEGFGAEGLLVRNDEEAGPALRRGKELAAGGRPVLINAICRKTEFRKGSLSM